MPTPILVSPQVRCPSCRNTLIFSLDTPGLTSLADFSPEPALTTLSGTNADFSPWNQRSLSANLAHKRCNCRSSFIIRRFLVLESGWPCRWAAISEFSLPNWPGQLQLCHHKILCFISKVYELFPCWQTINYWQKNMMLCCMRCREKRKRARVH